MVSKPYFRAIKKEEDTYTNHVEGSVGFSLPASTPSIMVASTSQSLISLVRLKPPPPAPDHLKKHGNHEALIHLLFLSQLQSKESMGLTLSWSSLAKRERWMKNHHYHQGRYRFRMGPPQPVQCPKARKLWLWSLPGPIHWSRPSQREGESLSDLESGEEVPLSEGGIHIGL